MVQRLLTLIALCLAQVFVAPTLADEPIIKGYLLFETWEGIGGSLVTDLTTNAAFPNDPTSADWRESIEIESNRAEEYAIRAGGYVVPPETGNYTFWIASDDASELWLSTDDNWVHAAKIAAVSGWTNERQWNKFPEQQSAEIPLVAGQRYYVDVFFKEGGGGDNLAVAWIGPGIGDDPTNPVVIQGDYLSPYIRTDDRALILKYYKARNPSPANGSYVGAAGLTLTWDPVIYAASHRVYLGEDSVHVANGTGGTDKGLVTGPAFSGYPFQLGKTYYWRVDEVEADGVTVYPGKVWSFSVVLMTASVPTPPDGSKFVDPNVVLGWVAGAGAANHEVYFGTDQTLVTQGDTAAFMGSQGTTTFVPGTLALGVKHYWRIDEVEADGSTRHIGPVWSFTTFPAVTVVDPNLMGWWKLDESQGNLAFDFSGHGNRGALNGGPIWTPGYDNGALDLDGKDDYVDTGKMASVFGVGGNAPRTVTVWVYTRAFTSGGGIYSMGPNGTAQQFALTTRPTANRWRMQYWFADVDFTVESSNQWVHFTHVHDGTRSKIYANGIRVVDAETTLDTRDGETFKLGTYRTNRFNGLIDDVRLYNKAVSQAEVSRIMAGDPALAWGPNPADGSSPDVDQAAALTWSPGDGAVQHDVYLGTDRAAVSAANTTNTTGLYLGRQSSTTYVPPAQLEWGRTYFWRIDEITQDGTLSEGKIWSFTVSDYLIAEDFEAYDDGCNRIFFSWLGGAPDSGSMDANCPRPAYAGNGSGSTIGNDAPPYAEQTIVHSDRQSMPFRFNNSVAPFYSEATREWPTPQSWLRSGANALTVYFRGDPMAFQETGADQVVMNGIGTDIFGTADQFHFAYKSLAGNGSLVARVDGLVDVDPWSLAGLVIREDLTPGAAYAGVFVTGDHGVRFRTRAVANGSATSDTSVATAEQIALRAPVWIKLDRTGNDFRASYSMDGTTWTSMAWNAQSVPMGSNVYVGLAVCSHNEAIPTSGRFSAISATGSVMGTAWQPIDIGVVQPAGNTPETLYLAVQDASGQLQVVSHPDPMAIASGAWEEWTIPYTEFTGVGVNLAGVQSMTLGVGDRTSPKAGGTGRLFIDDIRLVKRAAP
ncbi:MAG: DUF1349 domain-containing protein [Phycisphaerae bacterium]|nr:DUF1349 domain-containing protein [Phycisphaerae bacterium]